MARVSFGSPGALVSEIFTGVGFFIAIAEVVRDHGEYFGDGVVSLCVHGRGLAFTKKELGTRRSLLVRVRLVALAEWLGR